MSNQCYYCNQTFESRTDLYDHLVTHAKVGKVIEKKDEQPKVSKVIEKKDEQPKEDKQQQVIKDMEPDHMAKHTDIDAIKKKVEEIQKRIQSA